MNRALQPWKSLLIWVWYGNIPLLAEYPPQGEYFETLSPDPPGVSSICTKNRESAPATVSRTFCPKIRANAPRIAYLRETLFPPRPDEIST
jgi:hypothetical protein